ncbi:hypothetical protein Tco_1123558 [Tanacetum coccineum]|uniref:Uncharacterized protein n=1 Tax=Tanacetum coccineum TaxID=301880 RepID=A0ABQ5J6M8_9ASTR
MEQLDREVTVHLIVVLGFRLAADAAAVTGVKVSAAADGGGGAVVVLVVAVDDGSGVWYNDDDDDDGGGIMMMMDDGGWAVVGRQRSWRFSPLVVGPACGSICASFADAASVYGLRDLRMMVVVLWWAAVGRQPEEVEARGGK